MGGRRPRREKADPDLAMKRTPYKDLARNERLRPLQRNLPTGQGK